MSDQSAHQKPLLVVGFGACMIGGYPFEHEGLFDTACKLIAETSPQRVDARLVSLHSFPAPRAAKYLRRRVLNCAPDYVVIQFGATDANCRARAQKASRVRPHDHSGAVASTKETSSYKRPTLLRILRWEAASIIALLRRRKPVTPLSCYIDAIEQMVDQCLSAGVTPVVLSPFVYGSRYSTANAIRYTEALHKLRSQKPNMILVDCVELLTSTPKKNVLLSDGFHLSRLAHALIGRAIANAISGKITSGAGKLTKKSKARSGK